MSLEKENNVILPYVIENTPQGERHYDIYSRLLLDRIIFLNGQVDSDTASAIVAQMLFLEMDDPKADIQFYINSPGGSIVDGLAIHDTMKFITCDVSTICVGMAASMGAFLLASGTKGKRFALANSEVMIHQPSGGTQGTSEDIRIMAEHILQARKKLNQLLSEYTGQDVKTIDRDTDRDKYMSAVQAMEYGIIDEVLKERKK